MAGKTRCVCCTSWEQMTLAEAACRQSQLSQVPLCKLYVLRDLFSEHIGIIRCAMGLRMRWRFRYRGIDDHF